MSIRSMIRPRLAGVALAATAVVGFAATPAGAITYPVGGVAEALTNYVISPNASQGINNWLCRPSSAHPTPVVLVHATAMNVGANWTKIAPTLANQGYCVYGFNYGMTLLSAGRAGGLGDIKASAGTLASFVDKVRTATGSAKVDLIGHSQGGMMPNYYIKFLGGAAKVRTLVALSPSNHGTTMSGLVTLGKNLNIMGFVNSFFWGINVPGLAQQEKGSTFQNNLWAGGDTVAGPRYVVITTKYDLVVTPYTNAFLTGSRVTNILIQDQCPTDKVGHASIPYDGPTVQNVVNQLGAASTTFRATCTGFGPGL